LCHFKIGERAANPASVVQHEYPSGEHRARYRSRPDSDGGDSLFTNIAGQHAVEVLNTAPSGNALPLVLPGRSALYHQSHNQEDGTATPANYLSAPGSLALDKALGTSRFQAITLDSLASAKVLDAAVARHTR
jgi:hypothetical protein